MPRASKRSVDKNLRIELQDNFAYLISSLHKSSDIQQFFETFLTDEEKTMLTKRLMLHLMLEEQYDPAEIANLIGFSCETVYKHKLARLTGGKVYKAIIAKIVKRGKTKLFWKKVEKMLRPLELMQEAKSDMKARAKLASRDYE